jgi:flagellar assembly factor FliW
MTVVIEAAEHDVDTETEAVPTLRFVGPIAGFAAHGEFVLQEIDPASIVCALRSLDDPDVRFLVMPPGPCFPDYEPEISDDWAETLELSRAEDALVLVIVNAGASVADATVNLMAPIVINTVTLRAAQVVLSDAALPLRAPLSVA